MKRSILLIPASILLFLTWSCNNTSREFRSITPEIMKDKIAGGWAEK